MSEYEALQRIRERARPEAPRGRDYYRFICPDCPRRFPSRASMERHVEMSPHCGLDNPPEREKALSRLLRTVLRRP